MFLFCFSSSPNKHKRQQTTKLIATDNIYTEKETEKPLIALSIKYRRIGNKGIVAAASTKHTQASAKYTFITPFGIQKHRESAIE